jgi:hypothetical protein
MRIINSWYCCTNTNSILIIKRILRFLSPAVGYLNLFFPTIFLVPLKSPYSIDVPFGCLNFTNHQGLALWPFTIQFLALRITWRIIIYFSHKVMSAKLVNILIVYKLVYFSASISNTQRQNTTCKTNIFLPFELIHNQWWKSHKQ